MPYASQPFGMVLVGVSLLAFVVQEFSQGFRQPEGSEQADDRAAIWYLEVLPVVVVTVALVLCWQQIGVMAYSTVFFVIGLTVWWSGLVLRQWSHVTLGRFHQGVVTIHEGHELQVGGPYRLVRHPMYAGSMLAFLGLGLTLGTWPGLLLCVFATLPGMLRRITVEERAMSRALGAEYETYADGRARMVPGIW